MVINPLGIIMGHYDEEFGHLLPLSEPGDTNETYAERARMYIEDVLGNVFRPGVLMVRPATLARTIYYIGLTDKNTQYKLIDLFEKVTRMSFITGLEIKGVK